MIVIPASNAVYIALPHTASTSLREWLIRFHGGIKEGEDHSSYIPVSYHDALFFTVMRDPYDRAAGLWKKLARKPDREAHENYWKSAGIPFAKSLTDYCEMLVEGSFPPARRFVFWNQSKHLNGMKPRVLRFDKMPDALLELPFVDDVSTFPHRNRNGADKSDYPVVWTDRARDAVRTWAKEDFALLGGGS